MDIDVKDPKVVRWLLAVLVILVLVPVYFFTTVLPVTYKARRAEIAKLDARHQELGRDLEKARLLVRNLARVEKEYEILHEQWSVAQMLLPQKNEMPALLRKVTAAGSQSGVEFQLFKPGAPVSRAFYAENPVEVKVQGGYHQFGIFLSRLANLNRIVNVANLKLKGLDKQDDQPYVVEASMTISAYTLEGSAAPQPTDQGDGSQKLTQSGASDAGTASAGTGAGARTKNPIPRARNAAAKASAGAGAGGR